MFQKIFRFVFSAIGGIFGYYLAGWVKLLCKNAGYKFLQKMDIWQNFSYTLVFVVVFIILFFVLSLGLTKLAGKIAENIELDLQNLTAREIVFSTVGLFFGLALAFVAGQLFKLIRIPVLATILQVVTYLILGYLGLVIGRRQAKDTTLPAFVRRSRGGEAQEEKVEESPKILDTSVIIDGRILDILKTGFLEGQIIIPEFVLLELQHISDSSNDLKRVRGRRGLDVLAQIREEFGVEIYETSGDDALDEIPEVDIKLLKLAQRLDAKVITNDFNLNKVAGVKGVEVLNINDLANAVKPVVLPGEKMHLQLIREGKNQNQALAYLDDGTMIVVEDGKRHIGNAIDVVVTSVLQTSAGRMIFARPAG